MKNQRRNLNPHREARLAMIKWSAQYAAQGGGSMDFWDTLHESKKRLCREWCSLLESTERE